MKKIKIDVGMCTGCGQCALTCAFRNTGAFDLSQSNIKVVQWEDICLSVTLVCQQCKDAPCAAACPEEAIGFHPQTGAILIDLNRCTQCRNCSDECRYQVIHITPSGDPATCDLCGGDPKCVLACYPQALSFVDVPEEEWEPFRKYAQVLVGRARGRLVQPPAALSQEKIKPRRPV